MKTKSQIRKSFSVILFLFLFAIACNSQGLSAKKTVDNFLNVWLVKKDIKSVQNYFAKNLFTNKYLFNEPCRGSDEVRYLSKRRKSNSIRFFREIAQNSPKKFLPDILIFDTGIRDFSKVELLSDIEKDKFILTKEDLKIITSDFEQSNYLKSKFPSEKYLVLRLIINTKYDGEEGNIPIFILWAKQSFYWKIVYFGIECQ